MCQFIETIRIEDGVVYQLLRHTQRCNHTRAVHWEDAQAIDLQQVVRPPLEKGIYKCRIVYGKDIQEVSYAPYQMRKVSTLRLVTDDRVDYSFKSVNRTSLNNLYAQRNGAGDVLIVKEGRLTDTSIANVAFFDGEKWYTPSHPLLKGTMRATLLEDGVIEEKDIFLTDLWGYSKVMLFNAMIEWGCLCVPVDESHFLR